MTVFVIASKDPNPELESAIATAYPDKNFQFSDTVWFVTDSNTAKAVSEKIGVKKGGITGTVVFPTAGSYYGVAGSIVWDWLRASLEASENG